MAESGPAMGPTNSWKSTEFIALCMAVVFSLALVFNDRLDQAVEIFTWAVSVYIGQAGVRKALSGKGASQ